MRHVAAALVLLAMAAACGGAPPGSTGAGAASSSCDAACAGGSGAGGTTGIGSGTISSGGAATGGAGTGALVTGSVVDRYYGEGPAVDAPVDLTGLQVAAFTQQGSAWTTYPGTGKADGSFTIPSVPTGWIMVRAGASYVFTTARAVDLGSVHQGRPGTVQTGGDATVGGNLQNLAPWQDGDEVRWLNVGGSGGAFGLTSFPMPAAGATSLSGQPSTWLGALVDGSKGDVLYVTQLARQQAAPTVWIYPAVSFLSFAGVEQQDGVLTTLSGTLIPVTADQQVTLDFRVSAFAALADAVSPGAQAYPAGIEVVAAPHGSEVGILGYPTSVLEVSPSGDGDVSLDSVAYGNPFPPAWPTLFTAYKDWSQGYTAPGATTLGYVTGGVSVMAPVAQASAGPIVPVVTPVQALLVNGTSAVGALTGVSTTPTLAWSPSGTTTPSGDFVQVYEAVACGGATSMYVVA